MSTNPSSRTPSPHQADREAIYAPLNHARREIRVIEILPGPDDQPVRCVLYTQLLDAAATRYAALSYVWGDPSVTQDIIVNDRRLAVTTNLASALWHFRKYGFPRNEHTAEIRRLWVDAVCIDQGDVPEKNRQVHMMGAIYSGASAVLSWLGPPEPGRVDLAVEVVRDVAPILGIASSGCSEDPLEGVFKAVNGWSSPPPGQEPDPRLGWLRDDLNYLIRLPSTERVRHLKTLRRPSVKHLHYDIIKSLTEMVMAVLKRLTDRLGPLNDGAGNPSENWASVRSLHESEYWKRMWIIQEMALAKSPWTHWFVCGRQSVTFREFEAYKFFFEYACSTPYPPESRRDGDDDDDGAEQRSSWQSLRIVGIIPTLNVVRSFQWVLPERKGWRSFTLFEAASIAALYTRARDPRDAVYAILSLSHNSDILPDYDKPVRDVYLEAVVGGSDDDLEENIFPCLEYGGRGVRTEDEHGLPSWLLDLPTVGERRLFMLDDDRPVKKQLLGGLELRPPRIIGGDVLSIQGAVSSRVRLVKHMEFGFDMQSISIALYRLAVEYLVEFAGADRRAGRRPLQELISVLDWRKKDSRMTIDALRGYTGPPMSTVAWCFLRVVLLDAINVNESYKAEAARRLGVSTDSIHLALGNSLVDLDKCSLDSKIPVGNGQEISLDFVDMVRSCESKTLFLTGKGQLGLGPRYMQEGDIVCVVDRLTLPILLREVESPDSDGSHLEYIGSCYVSGLSDGEPADMVRNGELQLQTFEIH
ncbi:heterokaryon incompatibility protein-domain-containing protein [Hypoxylon sp. FL1150]|nr:heterokaryon incompatibility protein-domain-containing protein [Hypoxylon sp. FL1150]